MFDGKMKAVTFSYDDGITQDIRFIKLLDKYNLKCTFNLNSELFGKEDVLNFGGTDVSHIKVKPDEVKDIYKNHEIAVHTLTHPNLTQLPEDEIIRQVNGDRDNLMKLCGYEVNGMAYPYGGNDDRVAKVIKENTKIKYARTITSTLNFDLQDNLYLFNPTVYHLQFDEMFNLAEKFIKLQCETPKLFYIWGHSYELDVADYWTKIEKFFDLISGKDDIYYGTNDNVL